MNSNQHSVLRYLVVAMLIGVSWIAVGAQAAATEGVQLFNGRNGTGPTQPLPVGTFQVDGNQLSPGDGKEPNVSVIVTKGYNVRFCAEKNGSGKCEEYAEGTHNLASMDFNFIRVWKGDPTPVPMSIGNATTASATIVTPDSSAVKPLVVFEQKHWLGRSQVFGPGMYRSFRGEFGKLNDNQARAVVVAKGYRARFCSDEGLSFRGSGDCEVHEEGRHNLRFANSISFIEVTDLADTAPADERMPVVLYEDTHQGGRLQGYDVGTFLASQGQFRKLGNDQAESIAVRDGYKASVCSDEPVPAGAEGGNCEEFGSGKKNLKNRKAASYIKVWKAN